jgi:hypothetical protein
MTLHQKYGLLIAITCLAFGLPLVYTTLSWNKAVKERDFHKAKHERFEKRYELGDLDHTIEFEHTCGHRELFSMNKDQIHYLMQLQAHSCYECNGKRTESEEPL